MGAAMVSLRKAKADWGVPLALIALAAIPIIFGAIRVAEVAAGKATVENARFLAMPVPVALHIVTSIIYSMAGALQFAPRFRRQYPGWHRRAGWVLTSCALLSGLTGLWLNQFIAPGPEDGPLLYLVRLVFGVAMIVFIALGFIAIRRRNISQHRAWMMRAYALGLGAGTQALDHMVWLIFCPSPQETGRAMLMAAGWAINLAVVEWYLRRPPAVVVRAAARA